MSDDRNEFEVSTDVELKLREASKRFVADGRQTIPAAKRLAQLRAAAVSGNTHDQRVAPWPKASLWPAAAVAALVLGMLGFVLGWTGRSSAPAVGENPPAIKRQVAEDDNGAR